VAVVAAVAVAASAEMVTAVVAVTLVAVVTIASPAGSFCPVVAGDAKQSVPGNSRLRGVVFETPLIN
jgi:hypothetical protein